MKLPRFLRADTFDSYRGTDRTRSFQVALVEAAGEPGCFGLYMRIDATEVVLPVEMAREVHKMLGDIIAAIEEHTDEDSAQAR